MYKCRGYRIKRSEGQRGKRGRLKTYGLLLLLKEYKKRSTFVVLVVLFEMNNEK